MGQTGIACLKLTEVREEWGLSSLASTKWFMLLVVKSEPRLPDLFLMPVGERKKKSCSKHIVLTRCK